MTVLQQLAAAIPWWLPLVSVLIALGALTMTLVNLRKFRPPRADAPLPPQSPRVAVCIPARNEQDNLAECVAAVLANDVPNLRVLVYDDQSTDRTPQILADLCAKDARVASVATRPLPPGWVGKPWACEQLGRAAGAGDTPADWLMFVDADVRVAPNALRGALTFALERQVGMVSTFPRQITGSLAEALVVPLIHFILLSYLPFGRMQKTRDPNASAGCGQFLVVRRDAYLAAGTHAGFKDSMHDGIRMPRAVRRAGFSTDLFDGTALVTCRMYRGLGETWRGFAKNAYEGLGSPVLLIFLTLLHAVGHIGPWVMLALLALGGQAVSLPAALCLAAVAVTLAQRLTLAARFRQGTLGALLHPLGVAMMTAIQWHSFLLSITGRRGWRGRTLTPQHHHPAAPSAT